MALGCQTEAPWEVGLWWSPGIGGGGADCCSLLYRVSLMSLSSVPLAPAVSLSAQNSASQQAPNPRGMECRSGGWTRGMEPQTTHSAWGLHPSRGRL